jgi:hypothetical protein
VSGVFRHFSKYSGVTLTVLEEQNEHIQIIRGSVWSLQKFPGVFRVLKYFLKACGEVSEAKLT